MAVGGDWKGKLSPILYFLAIVLAFVSYWVAIGIYILVAFIWLVPDRASNASSNAKKHDHRDRLNSAFEELSRLSGVSVPVRQGCIGGKVYSWR